MLQYLRFVPKATNSRYLTPQKLNPNNIDLNELKNNELNEQSYASATENWWRPAGSMGSIAKEGYYQRQLNITDILKRKLNDTPNKTKSTKKSLLLHDGIYFKIY